ncbi:hypothetical protein CCR75_001360 [Bremia lactucae]|uniref:Uncharacterized protein n=1 Tax=Bremia lactucae TaxID=4779 RepID=A0A976FES4_BRELC|nr:hypothetical protein CCR75_001360 [Bremia lactucae]
MNAQLSQWGAPKVSRLWSAKGDERCSPPRSDDYKEWSLMQLKREITQRQIKTNPRRRNKDAFVRVLLANDQEQTQTPRIAVNQPQQTLDDSVLFVAAPTSELQSVYANNGGPLQQQESKEMYTTDGGQQHAFGTDGVQSQQLQQDVYGSELTHQSQSHPSELFSGGQRPSLFMEHAHHQDVFASSNEPQPTFMSNEVTVEIIQPSSGSVSQATASISTPSAPETDLRSRVFKRRRKESEDEQSAVSNGRRVATIEIGPTEYLRRKLNIKAARVEIESRRLDLETKQEQRNCELHAVQLALVKEQLQQAKISTRKLKSEWMVEQLIQKKRLTDAGISQDNPATLKMYMS